MSPLEENKELKQPPQGKSNRLSREFLAVLIHKLNNHLTAVEGFSKLLLLKLTSPDHRENIQVIINEAGRVSNILRALSDYIKERELQKKVVDINELVMKTVETRTHESSLQNINISTEVTPFIPLTQADPRQIQSVLFNLIENAEHAVFELQERGKIRIETKVRGENIEVIVTDNGPGITQENISKIFDPLFTTKEKRIGMGLSISHKIVESHGGRIEVKTEWGKGASFIVTLPIISSLVERDKGE